MNESAADGPKPALVLFLAASCGLIVANIYYAQPLVGLIGPAIGLSDQTASVIVTLTQLGYAAGLVLLVPLGDIIENRLLLTVTVLAAIPPLLVVAFADSGTLFLCAAAAVGLTSVAVQMLLPLAANLAPDAKRGQVVGNVLSGLLVGVLLARPVASLIAHGFGWRAVFGASAVVMLGLGAAFWRLLPRRQPEHAQSYFGLIGSLLKLPFNTPVLRQRSAYQAAGFGCFSLFWTAVPLLLAERFGYSQLGIAMFALVGASGAVMAPIAGRLADREHGRVGTVVALCSVAVSFLLAALGGTVLHSVWVLAIACVLLDCGVQANLVFGQRAIFALAPAMRSRLNGVFLALLFLGGAVGSAITSPVLSHFGWAGICVAGFIAPLLALVYFWMAERNV
jgi:predicted MFS family arabinose efflux permease